MKFDIEKRLKWSHKCQVVIFVLEVVVLDNWMIIEKNYYAKTISYFVCYNLHLAFLGCAKLFYRLHFAKNT